MNEIFMVNISPKNKFTIRIVLLYSTPSETIQTDTFFRAGEPLFVWVSVYIDVVELCVSFGASLIHWPAYQQCSCVLVV